MSYDFLSFSEKGKGKEKGLNLLICLSGFNIISFFIFWGTDRGVVGFLYSLVLFSFPVQIPLRYVFNIFSCLIYLMYYIFQYRKSHKGKRN